MGSIEGFFYVNKEDVIHSLQGRVQLHSMLIGRESEQGLVLIIGIQKLVIEKRELLRKKLINQINTSVTDKATTILSQFQCSRSDSYIHEP